MAFLELLEKNRSPFMDRVMLLVTELGGEFLLIAMGLVILWCVSKNLGRYMICVGTFGIALSQWLKILCAVPRPWVLKESFTIVEEARAGAGGYSFPSGHSQNVAALLGCVARWCKKTSVRIACAVIIALVTFSRMYLGVHTPWDVLAGCALSVILVFLMYPAFRKGDPGAVRRLLLLTLSVCAVYTLYMNVFPFGENAADSNVTGAIMDSWSILGIAAGGYLGFEIDERFVRFETGAAWYVQVIKAALGLALVMGLRVALKTPLNALFGSHPAADAVRYCIICAVSAGVWPMSFKYLRRIGGSKA